MRRVLLIAVLASSGCREMLGSASDFPGSDAPEYRDPAAHAAPVVVAQAEGGPPPIAGLQTTLLEHARAARSSGPKPAAVEAGVDPADGESATGEPEPGEPEPIRVPSDAERPQPLFERPTEEDDVPPAPTTPDAEAAAWLVTAADVPPGCIRNGAVPGLPLPSPEAVAWLLSSQPRGFTGVPREALVCLLGVGVATKAEVYGATAFRPSAIAVRTAMAGDERLVGVVAAAVATDEPKGFGTLVVVMDEREDGWTIRDNVYLPFDGSDATHKVVTVTDERIVMKKRSGIVVRQRDQDHMVEHHVTLTTQDVLLEIARFPIAGRDDAGTMEGAVTASGKSFPKALNYRALQRSRDGGQFVVEKWTAIGEAPYRLDSDEKGALDLPSVVTLLDGNRGADAGWVYDAIPAAARESADAFALGARVELARSRPKKAATYFKRALATPEHSADIQRDYAAFLAREKKKKDAIAAYEKYLDIAPDAADRSDVEAAIEALRGSRGR